MMNTEHWHKVLSRLSLGDVHVCSQVGSTNLLAESMIASGTPDLTLVVADQQTEGRGRAGRSWITRPGQGLACSLVIYPRQEWGEILLGRLGGLGGLAVAEVLQKGYGLPARIKWPNDVLIRGRKICGVLVEIHWQGDEMKHGVLGIGVNVHQGSIPEKAALRFPATCLEAEYGPGIKRLELLVSILQRVLELLDTFSGQEFIRRWENHLAYRGQEVLLTREGEEVDRGVVLGLSSLGELRLGGGGQAQRRYRTGEIQLRLVDRS